MPYTPKRNQVPKTANDRYVETTRKEVEQLKKRFPPPVAEPRPDNYQEALDEGMRKKEEAAPTTRTGMGEKFAKGGHLREKINRPNTNHGVMDMPNANLSKFRGMKHGGKVKRFSGGGDTEPETVDIQVSDGPQAPITPTAPETRKTPIVTKEQLAKSGLSLRDYMNKQQGKTRRGGVAKQPVPSAWSKLSDFVKKAYDEQGLWAATKEAAHQVPLAVREKGCGVGGYKTGGKVKTADKKEMSFMKAKGAPKGMVTHEKKESGTKKSGMPPAFIQKMMAKKADKKFAKGGGVESRGKTKGTVIKMASGGAVKGFAKGGGIESRGKTRCKMC